MAQTNPPPSGGGPQTVDRFFQGPWPWLLPLLLHAALTLWAGPAFYGSDDIAYAHDAEMIRRGEFQLTPSHFANRFGLILPTALSFALFGITPYSTVLWTWLCGQGTVLLLFFGLRRVLGREAAFLAALLLAVNPLWIEESLALGPDTPVTLLSLGVLLLAWRGRMAAAGEGWPLALAASLLFYLAMVTKLTAVWLLPPLLVLMIPDLLRGQARGFWGWSLLFTTLGGLLYLGGYDLATGDPLFHFRGVDAAGTVKPDIWSYADKSEDAVIARITYLPLRMFMISPGWQMPLLLALPALLIPLRGEPKALPHWRIATVGLLLAFWFGTRSYSVYNPMHLIPRMWLPLLPAVCILAGVTLSRFLSSDLPSLFRRGVVGLVVAIAGLALLSHLLGWWKFPLLLTGLMLGAGLLMAGGRRLPPFGLLLPLGVAVVTALHIHRGYIGTLPFQEPERTLVARHLAAPGGPMVVESDLRTTQAIAYYLHFRLPAGLELKAWRPGKPPEPVTDRRHLLFIRRHRIDTDAVMAPFREGDEVPGWRRLDGWNGVFLYEKVGP